ncbi:hypothetical protein N7G274_001028 [Stereocaulon virgatum]|uniref:Uncharacterized protein n=1 Tax=Stereocaulon virgatum TaxID=373712 RepID=A0ABR4AP35_9LECA
MPISLTKLSIHLLEHLCSVTRYKQSLAVLYEPVKTTFRKAAGTKSSSLLSPFLLRNRAFSLLALAHASIGSLEVLRSASRPHRRPTAAPNKLFFVSQVGGNTAGSALKILEIRSYLHNDGWVHSHLIVTRSGPSKRPI